MDLLKEIKEKISDFDSHPNQEGIKAAVRHIEVAERWLNRGRDERDDDLFNDVIYRTNQAFEGMLKEAYSILTGKDGSSLTPYKIEKKMMNDSILSDRVMALFTNYRQEWRNKSTHDHKLFFSEQESLLAIVSVSAFATILIDQMIEAVNVQQEKEQLQKRKKSLIKQLSEAKKTSFVEEVIALLKLFNDQLNDEHSDLQNIKEVELLGRLIGFIQSVTPDIDIIREKVILEKYHVDLILRRDDDEVIIEVKRGTPKWFSSFREGGMSQIHTYMRNTSIKHGILYIAPYELGQDTKISEVTLRKGGKKSNEVDTIHLVAPTSKNV